MRTPESQSAVEQIQALAHQLENAVNELLRHSELRPLNGMDNYHEWHATDPAAGTARVRALGLFHAFEDDLQWILSRHDPTNGQVHQMHAHPVFDIIDQHAHTQLASLDDARRAVSEFLSDCLRSLVALYDRLEGENLVVPDTNALIDYPELGRYHLGLPRTIVVFTPTVIRELEDHKRRLPKNAKDLQDVARWTNARAVIRRLKQCGDAGNILEGVSISGNDSDRVSVMALASEPKRENLPVYDGISIALPTALPPEPKRRGFPDWIDLDVADDRFIASALEVKREHPKARIVVVSGDFIVLTKSRAARLPARDAEAFFETG